MREFEGGGSAAKMLGVCSFANRNIKRGIANPAMGRIVACKVHAGSNFGREEGSKASELIACLLLP